MNRLAVWVAQTNLAATAPRILAQVMASPLPEIAAGAGLDADIAAPPLIATDLILGLESMARPSCFKPPGPLRHPMRRPCI